MLVAVDGVLENNNLDVLIVVVYFIIMLMIIFSVLAIFHTKQNADYSFNLKDVEIEFQGETFYDYKQIQPKQRTSYRILAEDEYGKLYVTTAFLKYSKIYYDYSFSQVFINLDVNFIEKKQPYIIRTYDIIGWRQLTTE